MAFPLGLPLKRFYKYLLKRVIGSFLKRDLDLEQLEVQLYQGLVQLKSLELDVTPLQLPAGLRCEAAVACVKMDVPWRRLVSDHCKVYVSGLHLVLTRGQDVKYQAPEPLKPPGGFFAEAPEEASRYSDDGIETLSRLVKRVLSRMQVCLQDASITVQLPPGALRARLSSALLFSDTSTEESVKSRTLRVGSFNLSMLPPPNLEEAGHGTGELVLMSSRGQEASAGVLVLQRRKQIAGGVHFDASLHLPAVRVALAPASCHALAEVLLSLSQALRSEKVPDIEELEKSSEKAEEPPLSPRPPSMVQSLVFQPETTSNIWHDLYRLFEADAQLDAATEGGSEAVEGEDDPLDMQEQEAFQDALEGEGWEAPSGAQWLSLKVLVDQSSAVLCLPRAEVGEDIWRHAAHHPQPRAVTFAAPMQRPEHQAQLCLAGICFTLEKQLKPEQAVPPNWGVSAECIEVHLHRRVHDDAREEAQEEEEEEPPAPAGAALGVSYVASDLWRSALSREGVEGNRTPSAPSEQCDTEESEGDESESFGESSVHSFGDTTPAASGVQQADDDEGIDDSDQELQDAFFDRQRGIDWLLPKLQARRPPAACRRHWRRSAPHFLSKQVVTFVTADRGSNSARSWPPAPIPDAGHPIWPTLGLGDQRRHLWVRHEVEEATASSSIRMSCLPLQLSVCAKTVQMLLQAVDSWKLAKTKSISEPGEASPSSPSSPRRNPEPPRLPTFVAIAPAIRLILRLPDGSSAVGDVVLPRLSAPSRPAAETDYEALRLEAASATVCLAAAKVKDLVSLRPKPGSPGVVHRNGLELSLFVSASGETSAAKPAEVSEEAAHAAEPAVPSDWTRYSAVGKPRPGGSAQGSHAAKPAPTEDRLPNQEKPPEPDRDLEDTSADFVSQRSRMEVELSLPGELLLQAEASTLKHLKTQAALFLADLPQPVEEREGQATPAAGPEDAPVLFGFTASLSRITCMLLGEEASEADPPGPRIAALQLSLMSCSARFARQGCFLAQDLRLDCLTEADGRGICTLARPWFSPLCERQGQPVAEEASLPLSAFLWQARPAVRIQPPKGEHSLKLQVADHISLHLCRLALSLERPLLQNISCWLQQFADEPGKAETEGEAARRFSAPNLKLSLLQCLVDIPSEAYCREWPSQGMVPMPPPKERGTETDKWRLVLEMSRLTGRIQRGEVRLRGGSITGYLSDHPANLTQLELLSESEDFLVAMGFVPILELDSVTASATLPEEPRSENEVRAEVHLGHVQCHLRADTVRCLRSLQSELSALLPVAIPVSMPEVVTQQPMPEGFDLGEDSLLTPECERLDDTDDHNILAGVDMFAFAPLDRVAPEPEASGSLAEALSSAMGEPGPGPQLLSPPVPAQELVRNSSDASSSCLVDEYIRAQELQQSPRSPVTACPWSPEEGPFEMELLELPEADETEEMEEREVEPHEESSSQEAHEAVAVCLFDPEALPEQRILELCDEEASARQEVEKQFHVEEPPPKSTTAGQVRYQEGSSVIFFQDPAGVQIVEDHFVPGSHPKHNQKFEPPPWAPPPKTVLMLRVDRLSLSAHQGSDFGGRPRDKESIASERRRTHLSVQVKEAAAKLMMFPARRSRPVARRRLVETSTLRWRLVLCARDFDILDRVHGSVFSHVLSYFEDEEKRPRPSMVDMLLLRVDELVHHALDAESEPPFPELAPEYYVDLQLLPLQLTVDQDTVDFLADFIQLCCLQDYVEELGDGQEDFLAAAGIAPDVTEEPQEVVEQVVPDPVQATTVSLFFQQVTVGSLLLSVDYKAKRLDVEALRRGELWELVNLLPLLEGLQVHFRSVSVNNARGTEQVLSQVVQAWSDDLNRTQLLRSLTGVTPIRSIANIGGGFAEMVLEPLKQYRAGEDAERVSRTMLRGLVSFLRHMTIESIDLTERVLVGAQATLEYANTRMGAEPKRQPRPEPSLDAHFEGPGTGSAGDWLPVERGSANFLQPGGAAEGLQEAGSSFTQGLRTAGPFLVRPLLEIQRGAPKEQVLRSVVSGIPMCVLRPALGATAAAATAIRGVRNSVDPSHRREMVRKYRGPG